MTEEIKKIEKEIDALIEERCALYKNLIVVDGNKIILRKSSPDWNKQLEIGEKIHSLLDELKKKEDEYLEENADVVPVEIIGLARPRINGKKLYMRILIKPYWNLRAPYKRDF